MFISSFHELPIFNIWILKFFGIFSNSSSENKWTWSLTGFRQKANSCWRSRIWVEAVIYMCSDWKCVSVIGCHCSMGSTFKYMIYMRNSTLKCDLHFKNNKENDIKNKDPYDRKLFTFRWDKKFMMDLQ